MDFAKQMELRRRDDEPKGRRVLSMDELVWLVKEGAMEVEAAYEELCDDGYGDVEPLSDRVVSTANAVVRLRFAMEVRREGEREDKRTLNRLHKVEDRCTHGYGDGLCECEPLAEHPAGY